MRLKCYALLHSKSKNLFPAASWKCQAVNTNKYTHTKYAIVEKAIVLLAGNDVDND